MITIKQVNTRIAKYGYELVKGKTYFYFAPINSDASQLYDSMVCVYRLNENTVDQWEEALRYKLDTQNFIG